MNVTSTFLLLDGPAAEPVFVVIRITPFLPASPYKTVAASPFKTLTSATLLGSRSRNLLEDVEPPLEKLLSAKVEASIGTPSKTNSGWFEPEIEV